LDNLVHFGAGYCSELDHYMALQPEHVLLVEGDPKVASILRERTLGLAQVVINKSVIAGQAGAASFICYNLPGTGALHEVAALLDIYPGLRKVDEFPVHTVTASSLLNTLELQPEQDNLLVIDLPGEELPVLKELLQSEKLYLFKDINLYCGQQPLYETGEKASVILNWLESHGFDLSDKGSNQNSDRPCWMLRRNSLQQHYQALQKQLVKQKAAYDEQVRLANERQAQIEQLTKAKNEQARLANERQAQIEQLTKAKNEQVRLANERQAQIEQLTKAKNEQARLANERQAQIEQLTKAKNEQLKLANERKTQIEQLTNAKNEQTHLAVSRQILCDQEKLRADNNQQELQNKQKELEKLEQQLAELNQRLPMLDNEFVKAEAQIELIKDILIREKAF